MKNKIIKISIIILTIVGISGFVFAETYQIKQGDTFSKIAKQYQLTIKELKQLNPQIKNINKIFTGKFLKIKQIFNTGFIEPEDKPLFGAATQPVAGATYTLSGSGISSSATSLTLTSFTIPQTGYEILDGDLSSTFYMTLEPGSRTRQEIISCTTVSQSGSDTTATISGCVRGLLPFYPYTASSTYQFSHAGGTSVVFSNPPQLYEEFANRFNTSTITGIWTFASSTLPRASSTPTYGAGSELYFATYGQVASTSYAGSVPMSSTAAGLVIGATQPQMAGGTATGVSAGTTYQLVPQNQYFNSTSTATTTVPVTNGSGKIHAGFIATSSNYIWSGNQTFNSTTTIAGTTTISASTTVSGLISFNSTTTLVGKLADTSGVELTRGGLILNTTSSDTNISNSTAQIQIFSTTTITGGELGTSGNLNLKVLISDLDILTGVNLYFNFFYGNASTTCTLYNNSIQSPTNYQGYINFDVINNASTTSQLNFCEGVFGGGIGTGRVATSSMHLVSQGVNTSVNTTGNQSFWATANFDTADTANSITITGAILRKFRTP